MNYDDVIQGLEAAGFTPSVLIDDVQRLIDEEAINHDVLKFQPKSAPFNYSAYHDLDEVCAGLDNIKLEYSLRLKMNHNDWLLADTCPQAANYCALF